MPSPWTPEMLERFRAAHDQETCQTAKDAIRRLAPEAFDKERPKQFTKGMIYLYDGGKDPWILGQDEYEPPCGISLRSGDYVAGDDILWQKCLSTDGHFMRSGRIMLFVKDGKIAEVVVHTDRLMVRRVIDLIRGG